MMWSKYIDHLKLTSAKCFVCVSGLSKTKGTFEKSSLNHISVSTRDLFHYLPKLLRTNSYMFKEEEEKKKTTPQQYMTM